MTKKPEWTFPDLPAFLAGLTLDHVAALRALVRRHGQLIGVSPTGAVHALKVREPASAYFAVIGSAGDAPLFVAPPEETGADDFAGIALAPGGEAAIVWSARVALADVLLCLEADDVIRSSQLAKSGKDGSN